MSKRRGKDPAFGGGFLLFLLVLLVAFWVAVCGFVPGTSDAAKWVWELFRDIANF